MTARMQPRVLPDPHGLGAWTIRETTRMGQPTPCIAYLPGYGSPEVLGINAYLTPERVALFSDLFARPMESVEADA